MSKWNFFGLISTEPDLLSLKCASGNIFYTFSFEIISYLKKRCEKNTKISIYSIPRFSNITNLILHILDYSLNLGLFLSFSETFEGKLKTQCPFTPEYLNVYFLKTGMLRYLPIFCQIWDLNIYRILICIWNLIYGLYSNPVIWPVIEKNIWPMNMSGHCLWPWAQLGCCVCCARCGRWPSPAIEQARVRLQK